MTPQEFAALPKDQQDILIKGLDNVQKMAETLHKKETESGLPTLDMKSFKEVIKGVIEEQIQGMTKVDKKHFMFPGIGDDKNMADDRTPQGKFAKTIKFLNALVRKDVQMLTTMQQAEGVKLLQESSTVAVGGALVPEEFKAEILRLAPQYGVLRSECRMIPMQFDTLNIPAAGGTDQTASWTNEAAQIVNTEPNFRMVTLTINKLAAIDTVSNELLTDANVPIIEYLADLIAEQLAKGEDQQGFNGTGSPFVGVLFATGVPASTHIGGAVALSYQDIVRTTGLLYTNARDNAKFYFHRTVVANIKGLITTAGAPIFGAQQNPPQVAGYNIRETEILPTSGTVTGTNYGVFGNLRRAVVMGERGSMQMDISREATVGSNNLWEKDLAAIRITERVTIGVVLPSAVVAIRG